MKSFNEDALSTSELTVIDLIESQVSKYANRLVYEYLRDGETTDGTLTIMQLHEKARGLAILIRQHCKRGDRVLLLFPSGLDYIVAFFATLYAGCVAVPAYPPQNQRRDWDRLLRIVNDCQPSLALSPATGKASGGFSDIEAWLSQQTLVTAVSAMAVDYTCQSLPALANDWRHPGVGSDDLAFLQYSSGSTGAPKGVMVTHQNVLHNQYVIQSSAQRHGSLRFVGWLPIYHDMGLICNIIQPLYSGSVLTLMTPAHVIQKPFRWLKAISDKRAQVSGGPNFIYDLCVDKISAEQKTEIDLSHWDVAFNGAEPVSVKTMRRFADAFAECGFEYKAFMPCYGLAENTLMVSSTLTREEPTLIDVKRRDLEVSQITFSSDEPRIEKKNILTLVSSGNRIVGQTVEIVEPQSFERCDDKQVGEVWVSGNSVAKGYWNQEELTKASFNQRIKPYVRGEPDPQRYMRTGDLGFFNDGHLFITGRIKDVIIIHGQNHYPQEIESSVQSASKHFRNSATAAFSVEIDGEERLVIVQELMPRSAKIADELFSTTLENKLLSTLRKAITERHQLELYDFVAIKFGTLSRTTSGKIQRFRNRERYLDSDIGAIYSSLNDLSKNHANRSFIEPKTDNEKRLATLWGDLLKLDKVSVSDNFFELGGHSLMLMQLVGVLRDHGFDLSAKDIFTASNLGELAEFLDELDTSLDKTPLSKNLDVSEPYGVDPRACIPGKCQQLHPSMLPLVSLSVVQLRWIESQVLGGVQNIQDIYPLASLQEGIFFHHRLNSEHDPYVMHRLFSVANEDSLKTLVDSLNFVIQRHDALRTSILWEELDAPVQVVLRKANLVVDSTPLETEAQARRSSEALCSSLGQTMDLTNAPLIRLKVFTNLETSSRYAVVQLHHIVVDNQCLTILERDMAAFQAGEQEALPLTPPYQHFIAFNQQRIGAHKLARHFFKRMLAGIDEPTLPLGLLEVKNHGLELSQARAEIPTEISEKIRSVAKQLKVSPATLFHSAWAMVVGAYSGRDDVVFGTVLSGRLQGVSGSENTLGAFINTLPVRIQLNCETGKALLDCHHQLCELLNHEQYPLVSAQTCSQVNAKSPLFSAVLNYRHSGHSVNERKQAFTDAGIQFLKLNERTNYPFTLSVDDFETGFDLLVQIDQAGQAGVVLKCMQHAIEQIVGCICDRRNERLCELSVIPTLVLEERTKHWVDTEQNFEKPPCIHQLFESQVQANPRSTALILDDQQLSYEGLNERANQIAHYLIRVHGVATGDLVGICLERSFDLFAVILGVLKAGAAYVPLDSSAPAARLRTILDDSQVKVLLTTQQISHYIDSAHSETARLNEEGVINEINTSSTLNIEPLVLSLKSDSLAYVIYTSGSTGKPKGVALEHAGLTNLSAAQQQNLIITQHSRVLQFASPAFDAATWEWCMALTNGATLVLAHQETIKDPERLSNYVQQQGVTHSTLPPAILPTLELERWGKVKTLVVAGDRCPLSDANRWAQNRTFINAYGPSETTVCASMGRFEPQKNNSQQERTLFIGGPLPNTQLYLLNEHLMPTPHGAVGELFVGGVGLARGYLNREQLNNTYFIDNPFYQVGSPHSSKRLYRTGDLVRSDLSANIEFVGRFDHQVKIRGFRVELGEIDRVLVEQSGVSEALVIADKVFNETIKLLAYVVPDFTALDESKFVDELAAKQVGDWAGAFEQTYQQTSESKSFVIDGWDSSYTRKPMPKAEMENWLSCTTKRIRDLCPKIALEIGCGAGLILKDIAPITQKYVGTDLSQNTVDNLISAIAKSELKGLDIELFQGEALKLKSETQELKSEAQDLVLSSEQTYDTVIINSVAQYFPNVDYLSQVIRNVTESMTAGGKLFIGDVRHFELLTVFHSSVLRYQRKSSTSTYEFLDQVQHNVDREHELAISPNWFYGLSNQLSSIESVEILPKVDSAINELSAFRYDVVITLAADNSERQRDGDHIKWVDCREMSSIGDFEYALNNLDDHELRLSVIGLHTLTNSRVSHEATVLSALQADFDTQKKTSSLSSVEADIGNQGKGDQEFNGISPADLQTYCDTHGYQLTLSWFPVTDYGSYHALISRSDKPHHYDWNQLRANLGYKTEVESLHKLSNDPVKARFLQCLPSRLKEALTLTLPDYMQPSEVILLASMPLNMNGKIDRKTLAAVNREGSRGQTDHNNYCAPKTDQQRVMCELWQDVLQLKRVGVNDDFFDLGGHSLLATRLVAQINQRFNVPFPVKTVFESRTLGAMVDALNGLTINSLVPLIEPVSRKQTLPLSYAQQRLWLLSQIDDDSRPYLMPGAFKLIGLLNLEALSYAFEQVLQRHESLRTTFITQRNGDPQQLIQANNGFNLGLVDLRLLAPNQQERKLHALLSEESTREFDLSNDVMLRATAYKLADQETVLQVVMHHIAADGWSLPILLQEISLHYRSALNDTLLSQPLITDQQPVLRDLVIQYADYAHWQRQWLRGDELERHLNYWSNHLSNLPELHNLPLDFARPSKQTFNGATILLHLNSKLTGQLQSVCKSSNATLFMGLHAAFSVLLARYSNESDIVIGSPVANREQAEVAGLIGFFVNMMVLRSDVSAEATFLEMISQSRSSLLDGYSHQQVPFERLVDALQPQRTMSHSPLFQIMLNLLSPEELTRPSLSGLDIEIIDLDLNIAKYDLTLQVQEVGEQLALTWEYNTDLFTASSIQRLADCFTNLLSSMLAEPNENIHNVKMLNHAEHELLLERWNDTSAEWPDYGVEALFSRKAAEHGNKIAANFTGASLTYNELDELSNKLSQLLKARGIGPNHLVGIAQQRSLLMLISVLAVMKAGAAYVPLDPSYPEDRIRFMLDDADLSLLLADQGVIDSDLLDELNTNSCPLINVSQPDEVSIDNIKVSENTACSSDLAYVIYTSGSTGKPKGVEVTRGNLTNFVLGMREILNISDADHLLAVTSLSFDIAVLELYLPLVCGAQVTIADELMSMDGKRLRKFIDGGLYAESPITIMQATPVTWALLLKAGWRHKQRSERHHKTPFTALCGGEAFPSELAKELIKHPINVWNLYGPTETTVWSTAYQLSQTPHAITDHVPIGRPISNTQIYVLDQRHNPVPIGAKGELYIGGAGVARGYLSNSELTHERFIDSRYGRLYQTGDLARYRNDGVLECLGRLDSQVKVRGYRIELGEIEACLRQNKLVSDAAVSVSTSLGEALLAAFVVLSNTEPEEGWLSKLKYDLSETLPTYMQPSIIVKLDGLPLTPNGKIDRKALPNPEYSTQQASYISPSTDTEIELSRIWQDLLVVERVGLNDNFFLLGGHSLLATQLLSQVNDTFKIDLPLKSLFGLNTLGELANAIDQQQPHMSDESFARMDNLLAELEHSDDLKI